MVSRYNNYYNTKPIEFVIKESVKLHEDSSYVPRFSKKDVNIVQGVPINTPIKPTEELFIKAIEYGMIFMINYKGEENKHFAGKERVIYPMVLGRSTKGKILLRGYHLSGWSVSANKPVNKIWRMFRLDRVLSVTFLGSFYRLPPVGYKMNDKGMRGGIIAKADFTKIRRNQQTLLSKDKIQNKDDIMMASGNKTISSINVQPTDTVLDLKNYEDNMYFKDSMDLDTLRITFMKSVVGNKYIAVINALGKPGNTVKVLDMKGYSIGVFKVMDSVTGDVFKKIKRVKTNSVFDLYLFDKKIM